MGTQEMSIDPVPASTVRSPKLMPKLYSVNPKIPSKAMSGTSRSAGTGRPRPSQTVSMTVEAMR